MKELRLKLLDENFISKKPNKNHIAQQNSRDVKSPKICIREYIFCLILNKGHFDYIKLKNFA